MKPGASLLALLTLLGSPCSHGDRGESRPVDLDRVAAAHRKAAKAFATAVEKIAVGDPLAKPFDSGLPSCRLRETRRITVDPLPPALVDRRFHFAATASKDEIWIPTRARQLRDVAGATLASPELAARLGVRCVPAVVIVRSEREVEIVEE